MLSASDHYCCFMKGNVKRSGNGIHDLVEQLNNYGYADSKILRTKAHFFRKMKSSTWKEMS